MKARAAPGASSFHVIGVVLLVSSVLGQAPYPPSGYRPSGQQFDIPRRKPTNQYGAPPRPPPNRPNQYEAPGNRPAVTVTPPDQYLPSLDPTFFRNSGGELTNIQQSSSGQTFEQNQGQQHGFLQNEGQQNYAPQNRQPVNYPQNQQPVNYPQNQQSVSFPQNQQQLGSNQQGYLKQSGQDRKLQQAEQQQGWTVGVQAQNQQGWSQAVASGGNQAFVRNQPEVSTQTPNSASLNRNYLTPQQTGVSANANEVFGTNQFEVSRQNSGTASLNRNYLTPQQNQNQQNQQSEQRQSAQQLYRTPEQNEEEEFISNGDENEGSDDDEARDVNVANQNYLPPTTTEGYLRKPTKRRKYPEPTTSRPDPQEPVESQNDEAEDPNVAIATAVARGQYYLFQPDGRLQRVTYKTTQTQEDLQNNGFAAKLVYQNVEPLTAPIYPYSAPLIRIN